MRQLETEFHWAGFSFPRYIPELSKSNYDKRTSRSVYYHAPKPLTGQRHPGQGFYLENAGAPSRWKWCDEVDGVSIRHTGWFCDEYQDDKIRGLVVLLPHGKYLAGWSMGEGMASEVDGEIYTDIVGAAYAANNLAENAADNAREYAEQEQARIDQEERNQGADEEETEGY